MGNSLPSRPNLDHLRRQAKSLLTELGCGSEHAIHAFQEHLPAAKSLSAAKVRSAGFRLADAQSVVARSTGFASWPQLARHVDLLRALEGVWSFESLEVDAESVPVAAMSQSRLLIDGDRFRTESPEANYEGVFNIDVEADPAHIDIEFVEGPEAGNWNFGIFRLEGDRLDICLDMHGKPRPSDFRTSKGSGHAYEVLRRSDASRPENVHGGDRTKAGTKREHVAKAPEVDRSVFDYVPSALLTQLAGEWVAEEIVRDGQLLPGMMLKTARRMARANEVTIRVGGMTIIHARVRLDESSSPIGIDYLHLSGASQGAVQHGIMEWRGETVRFCMGGVGKARPTTFTSEPGSGTTLSAWKRV